MQRLSPILLGHCRLVLLFIRSEMEFHPLSRHLLAGPAAASPIAIAAAAAPSAAAAAPSVAVTGPAVATGPAGATASYRAVGFSGCGLLPGR